MYDFTNINNLLKNILDGIDPITGEVFDRREMYNNDSLKRTLKPLYMISSGKSKPESKNLLKSAFRKKSTDFEEYSATYSFDCEKSEDLFNAIMALPKKLRTVIHLFYYEDLPIKEIADMLNIKQSAVKTRLCRAREQLKIELGDDWNDE